METVLNCIFVGLFAVFFLGLCIFVHELGHFLAAKWRGLYIVAFSIGFKKVLGFKHKGIEYRIGCIPCGGYVDLPQLDSHGDAKTENGEPLSRVKPLDRILTAGAGPFFNILFGFALGTVIWIHGIPQDTPKMHSIKVASVEEDSPEFKAGLRKGDNIVTINNKHFYTTWNDIVQKIIFTIGEVKLGICRGEQEFEISYLARENPNVLSGEGLAYPFFKPKIPVAIRPMPGSPAEKAGIKDNDIVIRVNREKITGYKDFLDIINKNQGRPLHFVIQRDGELMEVKNIIPSLVVQKEKVYCLGIMFESDVLPIKVTEVLSDSAAEASGFKVNDIILKIDGRKMATSEVFLSTIRKSGGRPLVFEIERNKELIVIKDVIPKLLEEYTIGIQHVFYNHPTPWEQFTEVIGKTYGVIRGIFSEKSTIKAKHMSGPIGIVRVISIIVYHGNIIQALYLIVIITFSLALFNLLPIPILDGGHILIALIESIGRRPLPVRVVKPIFTTSLILLISLMVFVTFFDVKRSFGGFFRKLGDVFSVFEKTQEDKSK